MHRNASQVPLLLARWPRPARFDHARRGIARAGATLAPSSVDGPAVGANECTRYRGPYRVGVVDTPIDDDRTDSVRPCARVRPHRRCGCDERPSPGVGQAQCVPWVSRGRLG